MRLLNSIILIMCLIPISVLAQGQQRAAIEGYIKDAKTGEHLLSANVAVRETQTGISSDVEGFFVLDNLNPGKYTLVCSYIGYQKYEESIVLKEGETLKLNVELVPKSLQMDEIVVSSEVEGSIERRHISAMRINKEFTQTLPVVESDVFQSLQILPGVQASSELSSNLYVRGGAPDQTLILLDDTPVFGPTHFFGFFSTFNPDIIKGIDFYKGAYPAKYGGRLGSVLALSSQRGNINKFTGSMTASMLASRASLEGPLPKGSWKITGRRSTIGPVLDVLRKSISGMPDEYHFFDINGSINIAPNANNVFSLSAYSGQDNILFPITGLGDLKMLYGNRLANANWKHQFSDKFFITLSLSGSHYYRESTISQAGVSKSKKNDIEAYTAKLEMEYSPVSTHTFSSGFSANITKVGLLEKLSLDTAFDQDLENRLATFYVQDEWQPSSKWRFTPGFRLSFSENGEYVDVQPRITAEFIPSDKFSFYASYGHYNQYMSMMTNEAATGFNVWLPASDGVAPAKGKQYVVGLKSTPFEKYGFNLNLYHKQMHNLFELDPYSWDKNNRPYAELFRIGEGYAYGLEAFMEKKAGRITGFVGYSLGYTWRKFPGYNVDPASKKPEARYYPPKYDRRHDMNIALSYALTDHWKLTAVFTYATGQAYTMVKGRYATTTNTYVPFRENVFVVDKVNSSRLPDYHRLDLSVSRKGRLFKQMDSILKIQVINAYSHRNTWFYTYYFLNNPVERTEIKLLPIIPVASITINY